MAIHFTNNAGVTVGFAFMSGWSTPFGCNDTAHTAATQVAMASLPMFQPSAQSRPGNLGTAYAGVWTENTTAPDDNHRPIPFKVLGRSLIYQSGIDNALMTM